MILTYLQGAIWFLCLAAAALLDCKTRKIPNRLILTGLLLATILAALQGTDALLNAVAGGSAALAAGFLLWKIRLFRAGDAKLLWMTMQFAGWNRWGWHMASILLAGGVCALLIMLRHRILIQRIRRVAGYLGGLLLTRSYTPYQPVADDPVRLPFAVPVFLGELAACILLRSQIK